MDVDLLVTGATTDVRARLSAYISQGDDSPVFVLFLYTAGYQSGRLQETSRGSHREAGDQSELNAMSAHY